MKRTPLKRMSAKKRKEINETRKIRMIEPGTACECCLLTEATDTHEIPAGAHRHCAVYEPLAQMRLCRPCHDLLQGETYSMQIAFKLRAVVEAVNRCCGSCAVDIKDVIKSMG